MISLSPSLRLCGSRSLQPYSQRLFLTSTSATVVMTSEVSLTGPGLQLHYSLFNLSDRTLEAETETTTREKKKFSLPLIHKQRVFVFVFVFVLQPAQVSLCAQSMVSAYLPATASTTVPMDLTRQTVVIIQALLNTSFSH